MDRVKKLVSLYSKITGESSEESLSKTTTDMLTKSKKSLGKYPK